MSKRKSAMLGMAAATAVSGASFSALAAPCTTALLTTYLSGGSNATCTVLDKTISGMSFSDFNNLPPTALTLTVTPVLVTNDPGLRFSMTAGDASTGPSISYTISAPSSDQITGASLSLTFTGDGNFARVTETLSNGQSLSVSTSAPTASLTFAALTSLTVTDAIDASLDLTVENRFSETPVSTPEPSSLALLGIGLPALALVRRRRKRS
jgi:hypothetical protein